MSISSFLIAVLLALVGWLWWVRRRGETRSVSSASETQEPYRCVAIRPGQEACQAVRNLAGRRFLGRAAPPLPLDNCAVASCRCRYDHFADRREDERRHSNALLRGLTPHADNNDHRSGRDRRRAAGSAAGAMH
jgi:hypothetical protein